MLRSLLRSDGDLRFVLTALCLVALVATFAVPVLSPGLAAYTPEHGHLTLAGPVPVNHVHPWDADDGAPTDTKSDHSDVAFALASDGDAASGWASATLVPSALAIAGPALVVAVAVLQDAEPEARVGVPRPPPPRT